MSISSQEPSASTHNCAICVRSSSKSVQPAQGNDHKGKWIPKMGSKGAVHVPSSRALIQSRQMSCRCQLNTQCRACETAASEDEALKCPPAWQNVMASTSSFPICMSASFLESSSCVVPLKSLCRSGACKQCLLIHLPCTGSVACI